MAVKKQAADLEEKPLNQGAKKHPRNKTFGEKWSSFKDNITVEPLLTGLVIPSVISKFAMENLNLDKACRVNLQFEDHICDALIDKSSNNFTEYERKVQELISSIDIWKSVIQTAFPCLLIMFLGAWSDRTGKRKIIILLPIYGEILTCINNLINVYFFYEIPVEYTVLLETLFSSFTGGWVTMFLGVFSYISDITDEKTRTFRVGMLNFCMTSGVPIGMALSGFLLSSMGYYALFSTTGAMFLLVLMYGMYCLVEPEEWLAKNGYPPIERPECPDVAFFDISHIIDTVSMAFRPRKDNKRIKLILILTAVFILYGPMASERQVFYLFVRNQLNWDMIRFGLYTSYSILLHSIGAIFSITVLSRRMQVDDALLCFLSITSKFGSSIWTAFVTSNWEMYVIPLADIMNATTFTSLRSILSKTVDQHETAKVNSVFSLTETLASLVFQSLYSWLYMKTLHVLPGAVFLTSAVLTVPAAIILVSFYIQNKKEARSRRKKMLKAEENKEEVELKATFANNIDSNENSDNSLIP